MRTVLRLTALLILVAVVADAVALSAGNGAVVGAGILLLMAATGWRHAVLPAALGAGLLYLMALIAGHIAYDPGGVFVGAALVAFVDVSAWSQATPAHAAVSLRTVVHLTAQEVLTLIVGAGMAWVVLVGRTQPSQHPMLPWVAGIATVAVALLLPVLRSRREPQES